MTATKFGVVYSLPKKMVRRLLVFRFKAYGVYFDEWWMTDADFDEHVLIPGEAMILIDLKHWHAGQEAQFKAIDEAIFAKHGEHAILPGNPFGNCAIINPITGHVEGVIRADDEVDTLGDRILRNDLFVHEGDIFDFDLKTFRTPLRLRPYKNKLMSSVTCFKKAA